MLSREQFQQLRNKGLSVEQIVKFEKGEIPKMKTEEQQKNFGRKAFDFFTKSEQAFGKTLGGAIATGSKDVKGAQKSAVELSDISQRLGKMIVEQKKLGKDTTRLEKQWKENTGKSFDLGEIIPETKKTAKQIYGEGLGVATDIVGYGSLKRKGAEILKKPVSGLLNGAWAGAKTGAKAGAGFGGVQGISRAMQEDKSTGEIIGAGFGGAAIGAAAGGALGGITGGVGGAINKKREIKNLLNQIKKPIEVVKYKTEYKPSGAIKIKTDKIAKEAIDKGIESNRVNLIKNASKDDRNVFQKMFKIAKEGSEDLTVEKRPVQLAGDSLLERTKYVLNGKKNIGNALNKSIKNMPKKPINISNVYDDFTDDLLDAGVRIKGEGKLDFRNSRFANTASTQKQLQYLFDDIRPNTAGDVLRTPQRINAIRQKLFDDLSLGKTSNELSDSGMRLMTKARSNLLKPLENLSGEFKKQNTSYAKIMKSLTEFNKIMGKDFNIEHDLANLRASEVINRLASNVPARPSTMISNLEDIAIELGYKKTSDIRTQVLFADMMEDLFGLQAPKGFGGQIQRSTEKAMEGMGVVEDIANKNIGTIITKTLRKIKGVTPEKQQEIIKKLIGL